MSDQKKNEMDALLETMEGFAIKADDLTRKMGSVIESESRGLSRMELVMPDQIRQTMKILEDSGPESINHILVKVIEMGLGMYILKALSGGEANPVDSDKASRVFDSKFIKNVTSLSLLECHLVLFCAMTSASEPLQDLIASTVKSSREASQIPDNVLDIFSAANSSTVH